MTPDEARALGAQALFGEKYGDEVRVVSMGPCRDGQGGGRPPIRWNFAAARMCARTGDIGAFVLLGDSASSAGRAPDRGADGARRAGRICGAGRRALTEIARDAEGAAGDVPERVRALMDERRALQNEVADLRRKLAMGGRAGGSEKPSEINGVAFVAQVLPACRARTCRR